MTEFRHCQARYEEQGVQKCIHPRSGYTKKPVTPEICAGCPFVIGDLVQIPLPSAGTRVKSAIKAAVEVLQDPTPVTPEELARRQAICNGCKYQDGRVCRACGCNLPAKQRKANWRCDLGFWD